MSVARSFGSVRETATHKTPIRLLVCGTHRVFRAGLRLLVEADASVTVVAEADSAAAMLTTAQVQRPDIILLDDDLCETVPDTLWMALRLTAPAARVLLLMDTRRTDAPQVLVRNPGLGAVSKADAPEALLRAIRELHSSELSDERRPEPAGQSVRRPANATADDLKQRVLSAVTLVQQRMHVPDKRVRAVLQTVEDDLRKSESIEVLASSVGIGGSRLRHLLREFIGMSLNQFRKERRLQVAAHLLARGHQRVSEIAYEVGFGDMAYFNKEFRKRFKLSPTSYRQANAPQIDH
jgi:AraC-like DNA-binding protein